MSDAQYAEPGPGAVSSHLERIAPCARADAAELAVRALLDDLVAADPEIGTWLGLSAGADRLPSWSAAALARRCSDLHRHERRLRPLLADEDVVVAVDAFAALEIVHRRLRDLEMRDVASRRPSLYLEAVNGLFPFVTRELGTPAQRLAALAGRLRAVPGLLEEARANLGGELSEVSVTFAIGLAEGLLHLIGPTMHEFAAAIGRAGALDRESAAAVAAMARFRDHLRETCLPAATARCGAGRDVIEDILLWEHVLRDTPEDLAAYGRCVLAETKARMEEIAAGLGYADAGAAVAAVQGDGPTREGLVVAYHDAVSAAREYISDHDIVTIPSGEELEVLATPAFLRTALPYAAYYQPGPLETRQLGYYFVTPPDDDLAGSELRNALRNHPFASLPTTGVHEAYPGHHLQLVSANRAPTTARRVAHLYDGGNILIEGWAFYCEELMEREGFLVDPRVRLMRLNDQVWRACRVVIDIELHLGVMGFDDAVRFLATESHADVGDSRLECARYAEQPGQAMSYLLGKREVTRLAAAWREARPGTRREFHDELLAWG
ncbi:MAG: DUF885 domain-containing protein, partial [Candidatus Bipolaricaulia bacterium]